mgnify:CR=1 FL=1
MSYSEKCIIIFLRNKKTGCLQSIYQVAKDLEQKKGSSVETEQPLTIACHMKKNSFDVICSLPTAFRCLYVLPIAS